MGRVEMTIDEGIVHARISRIALAIGIEHLHVVEHVTFSLSPELR